MKICAKGFNWQVFYYITIYENYKRLLYCCQRMRSWTFEFEVKSQITLQQSIYQMKLAYEFCSCACMQRQTIATATNAQM